MGRIARFAALALLALATGSGCGGDGGPAEPTITSVTVNPTSLTLGGVGSTGTLTATVLGPLGAPIVSPSVTWTSQTPSVATVSGSGTTATVTAVSGGTATIRAVAGGVAGTATVEVESRVRSVTIAPSVPTVRVAETTQLTATVDADLGVPRTVTWSTSAAGTATVSAAGLVTGVAVGTATITATSTADPTKSNSVQVTVNPAAVARVTVTINQATLSLGQTAQATATAFDAQNRALTGRTFTWSSSNTALATVSQTGLVTAASKGAAQISASVDGQSGAVTVTVLGITSVTVSPKPLTLPRGSGQQLNVAVVADPGFPQTVTWRSTNSAIVSTNSTGLIVAVTGGAAFVVATSTADPAKRDSTLVTVPNGCTTPTPHTLGTTANSAITVADCDGRREFFEYVATATTYFSATITAPFAGVLWPFTSTGNAGTSFGANVALSVHALAAAGTHRLEVTVNDTLQRGAYTLTTTVNPGTACPTVFASLGVARQFNLAPSCPAFTPQGLAGSFVAQAFLVTVPANKQLRVVATAAGYAARIELKTFSNVVVTTAFASAAGQAAVVTFTPTAQSTMLVFITSQAPNQAGAYTITIDP